MLRRELRRVIWNGGRFACCCGGARPLAYISHVRFKGRLGGDFCSAYQLRALCQECAEAYAKEFGLKLPEGPPGDSL
jgi:hypothetical protein